MKAVNRIADQRVRVLINTDHHVEHTGSNAQFLQAGVQILAQENVKNNLAAYDPPGGRIAPPTKTYDREFTLQGGGIEVQLLHLGNAATSGDTVVYFQDLKVVALGDLYTPTPVPDYAAGGSLVGWGSALDAILKFDFDIAVPGDGPLITRADLAAYRVKIGRLVSRATSLVREGVPKDRLMSRLKTDDLGWQFDFTGSQLDLFYADLSLSK
jgi:glyoxylase-like metal-dependent hydrolase (beta-lactamase superfamily II)